MSAAPDQAASPEQLQEEQRRLARLRRLVDTTCALLMQAQLERAEGEALVAAAREQVLSLFPDKASTYDLILRPRFARLIEEFARAPTARILRFPLQSR